MVASVAVVPEDELPRMPTERQAEAAPRRVHTSRNVELRKYCSTQGCRGFVAAETGRACRQGIEAAMGADGVERARVGANRRARDGVFEDLRVGEPATGEEDANEGGAAGGTEPMTRRGHRPGADETRPEASPVRRRALRFRRSRMRCRHSGQSSVPSSRTVPRRRPEAVTSTSGI